MHFWEVLSYVIVIIKEVLTVFESEVFALRTEGCSIIDYPEVSDNIKSFVGPPQDSQNCASSMQLVTSNTSHIWVIEEALPSFNVLKEELFYCCYTNFSAIANMSNINYGDCKLFSSVIKAEHEFVRVECYYLDNKVYENFFLFNSLDPISNTASNKDSYNVLILGIESMSRLNFHRTMPLTANFLKDKGMIELLGYNKIGDNSFPNLFPILTGLSFDYVKQAYTRNKVLDLNKCQFIWDKFKEKGYQTALGSDSIAAVLGTYEYSLRRQPTDNYLQPFIFETRNLFKDQHYNFHQCMGSKFFYQILLDYIYSLTHKLKNNNFFGMFWEESVSHEDLNMPNIMDESYHNFLKELHKENYLNKTVLVLLSDHGMRWGPIVQTAQGRSEERLPLLGILFPEQFRRRHKLAIKNILINTKRLTTPFDIYKTLLDLLNLKSLEDLALIERYRTLGSEYSLHSKTSLFLPVSPKRNCTTVGIEEHWCSCHKGKRIKIGSKLKISAALKLVMRLNELLNNYPQCQTLVLRRIYDVSLVENHKKWKIYTVMVKTAPGGGIFDATLIRRDASNWVVSGTVSRLNLYGNQSYCVPDATLKMYCFCG
ncbi:uncharacterized protein LOC113493268 [Trichoplusia ni]|uniref:Uncharacterized protein LOC113493268 n=1 Tax=Trichoplusia ni TaxID=7111 RepID=A0A7E5VF98_TRINI|nr:uncharacterized protein LOC113493268 [Trichoplusia ni]